MVVGNQGSLRLAVAGARRVRQGTGPYLALHASELGAQVAAVVGRTPETAEAAAGWLGERGCPTAPCTDLATTVREHGVEALVIASPIGTHEPLLDEALALRLHVLCEKPLLATPEGLAGSGARAAALSRAFADAGLLLRENCQWPFALDAYRALHPDLSVERATRFRMEMAPPHAGIALLLEVLSHPISLLQATGTGPVAIEGLRFEESRTPTDRAGLELRFDWVAPDRRLACTLRFEDRGVFPRPAAFAFDDHPAHREVRDPGYRMVLREAPQDAPGAREVPLPDPMRALLGAWLEELGAVRAGASGAVVDQDLVARQALLETVCAAWRTVHA